MGASQRTKGRAYEQDVARFYRELGYEARRGWQTRQGSDDPDVVLEGCPYWVECSHRKQGNWIYDKWAQAAESAKLRPIVLHVKADRKPELVVLSLEFWKQIQEIIK